MIYNKVTEIMTELIPIGKIRREEITTVMQPLLAKYKLVLKPAEISEYKFANQESSFKVKYELVDAEDANLSSIMMEVPGGGSDQEGKGRSTYMASTGAYRQALQQLFAIQIEDELYQQNVNDFDNGPDDFTPVHDFEDSENIQPKQVQNNVNNTNNINNANVLSIPNNTVVQNEPVLDMDNLTDTMIDEEFADFLG